MSLSQMSQDSKPKKEFNKSARRFHIVLNEASLPHLGDVISYLRNEQCVYLLCRKGLNKRHLEHAHIYVVYNGTRRLSSKNTYGAHLAKCRGDSRQNLIYINGHHPEKVAEYGNPEDLKDKKERWQDFVAEIKSLTVSKYDPLFARYENYATKRMMEIEQDLDEEYPGDLREKNCWIYGPKGTFKSTAAKYLNHPKRYFVKSTNKWWDGYNGQKIIVMEELSPATGNALANLLKVWTDKWGYQAECKCSHVYVKSGCEFIVTSNYSIDDCFNKTDADALKRRFCILHFTKTECIDETDYS